MNTYNHLLVNELMKQLSIILKAENNIGKLITLMRCTAFTDKSIGSFDQRYKDGLNWEQYTLNRLIEKNKDITYSYIKGKECKGDILATKGNHQINIEVKSETESNKYNRIFIKSRQFNEYKLEWDRSNLLTGSNNDLWIHYFLYNDKWHYIKMSKGELKQLCRSIGTLKIINSNNPYKAMQQGYLLNIDDISYKPLYLTMKVA